MIEFKGLKQIPEELYAKQYHDLSEQLDIVRRGEPRRDKYGKLDCHLPVDTSESQRGARACLEGALEKVKIEIINKFIKPKLKYPHDIDNIENSFHNWEMKWVLFYQNCDESHNLHPNACVDDLENALAHRNAEIEINDRYEQFKFCGETEMTPVELPDKNYYDFKLEDKSPLEREQARREAEEFGKICREVMARGNGGLRDVNASKGLLAELNAETPAEKIYAPGSILSNEEIDMLTRSLLGDKE